MRLYLLVVLSFAVFTAGCIGQSQQASSEGATASDWHDLPLKDVRTGETFKISDFRDKPVLLESFAVWCPVCLEQQRQIAEMRALEENGNIVHVSLDTDQNEDEARVREHLQRYGFDWYFAVPPQEFTDALRAQYGLTIVHAPSAPMVLVCEDGSTRFLRTGVKPPEELFSEVEKGCNL
ncbi:MAG: redoxin family protein [Candidatus Aenigmarchaeota archaeon]|nr:redoxin family protein [Candidatus Aenigmarchaeota archaeon]